MRLSAPGAASSELAVAPAALLPQALALGARFLVLEGRGARAGLASAGLRAERLLPLPRLEEPELLLPLDRPAPARYAVARWTVPDRRWKLARNELLRVLLSRGVFPELRPVVTIGSRDTAPPFLVTAAARRFPIPADCEWFLTLGEGDALTRGVFHLFPPRSAVPRWVLKFARVRRYAEPFDRDERGLGIASTSGRAAADHAPRLLGRFQTEGLHASVETSAVGQRLTSLLQSPGRAAAKVAMVDSVADWLLSVAGETASGPDALESERRRLLEEVTPRWIDGGANTDLVRHLDSVPAVLQHNDLGPWNIVAGGGSFTAVDWESARRHGLPLWDLLYFLAEALALLDGAVEPDARDVHFVRLFRGELPASQLLFRRVRQAVEASQIPAGAVAPLATLCWLHHGLSHLARGEAVRRFAPGAGRSSPPPERMARLWLADPALGSGWDRWRS